MDKLYPVYTLENECQDCYKCVRECYIKAIKIENGHASIMPEKCIACGRCVMTCPSNAKRVRDDIEKVKNLLRAQKRVYISLAPSWRGVFELGAPKMISILKSLGFEGVSETALGAQEVSISTAKILKDAGSGLFISSACPAIVDYVRYYMSDYTDNITPIASPALTHAKMLKNTYGNDISVVFIGPCIAKKNEADRHPDLIDVALTFDEFFRWLNDDGINIENIARTENETFVPESAYEGALYPIEGGMNETIKKCGVPADTQLLSVSSLDAFKSAIKGLNLNNIKKTIFIEALACDGGCVSGPGISIKKARVSIMSNIISKLKERNEIPQQNKVFLQEKFVPKSVKMASFPIDEILKALKKIGKHNIEDELNCGGCGYDTCRELAQALIAKEAETSMCVSYMRKIAMRKAAAMLRCMPSAIVMTDSALNVVEANDAFMKMFCGDMYEIFSSRQDGVVGAAIDRLVPFVEIFRSALKTGKDIHKERYPVKNRLYDITAFTIEPNQIVGAVITDVTQTEMRRDQIAKKAQEVISKNIAIVQDIACLLGEHMVDTELLLSSIADGFDSENDGDKK